MFPESSSSFSFTESEESLHYSYSKNEIRGIPDIFSATTGLNRASLAKPVRTPEQVHFSFETNSLICRICHGGYSSGDLLTPCRCRGSIALAHLQCLETWLNESNRNECELCQYHFRVVREPRYGILGSIFVFLRHPGPYLPELLIDLFTFVVYTPSTITSTYMLMLLCDSISKSNIKFRKSMVSHILAFSAVFGIAAINFTYTSWFVLTFEKYVEYWRDWYRKTCTLKVVLSANKLNTMRQIQEESNSPP